MTAWTIRKFVLACDHFDAPDVPALLGTGDPKRCSARFDAGFTVSERAATRKLAAKKGWIHVHEPYTSRTTDKDYCPKHASDAG
jgi:hypothetical protein